MPAPWDGFNLFVGLYLFGLEIWLLGALACLVVVGVLQLITMLAGSRPPSVSRNSTGGE